MRRWSVLAFLLVAFVLLAAALLPGRLLHRQEEKLFQQTGTLEAEPYRFDSEGESTLYQRISARLSSYYDLEFSAGATLYYDKQGLVRRFLEELELLAETNLAGREVLAALEANVGTLEELRLEEIGENLTVSYLMAADLSTGETYLMGRLNLWNYGTFALEMDMVSGKIINLSANLDNIVDAFLADPDAFPQFAESYAAYLGLMIPWQTQPVWEEGYQTFQGSVGMADPGHPDQLLRFSLFLTSDYMQCSLQSEK